MHALTTGMMLFSLTILASWEGREKKVDYLAYGVLGSERGEEVTDVFLKDYDECNGTNVHGFVHYGAEETHVENLRNEYPHYYEHEYSHEDVSGARLFH